MCIKMELAELVRQEFLGVAFYVRAVEARLGGAKPLPADPADGRFQEFGAEVWLEEGRES